MTVQVVEIMSYLSELYFNHKKIELNLISDHTYLIDNTK